jgi:hypothetical protein
VFDGKTYQPTLDFGGHAVQLAVYSSEGGKR